MQVPDDFETDKTFVDRMPDWQNGGSARGGAAAEEAAAAITAEPVTSALKQSPTAGKTRIGSGIITELIARGGMAAVYKVWNERIEVFRAVKLLERAELGARFNTEAMITAKLRHPNIVEIYDAGEWNGLPYMEMEYVDGENLQQTLNRRGRFPEAVCCAAAIRAAEALLYAHTLKFSMNGKPYCGIIHRDLKPANIMISTRGEIKLTDFGIARPAQASLHTLEGNIVGTLHYLSPEQMEGNAVDHRSDIYSFGAILYEMATGVKTFPQQTITELMKQRNTNSFKMPHEHGFPIKAALSNIIIRCLRYSPHKRYPDAARLLEGLRDAYSQFSDAPPRQLLSEYFSGEAYTGDNRQTEILADNHYDTFDTEEPAYSRPKLAEGLKKIPINAAPAGKFPVRKKPPARKNSSIGITLIISMTALAVLSLSYITARFITARPRSPKISFNSLIAAESKEINLNAAPGEPAAPPPKTAAAANTPKPAAAPQKTTPEPASGSAAPKAELGLLRDAAIASNKKQWNTAIEILETGNLFPERYNIRTLLLLEAYVESKRFDKALPLMDSAAKTGDAHYLLSAGKFWYYKGNHTKALELLESSMTRPSVSKYKNAISGDALYYIADIRQERFRAAPSDQNRAMALDGWRKFRSAYGSKPGDPRFERAEKEITDITGD